MIIRTKKEERAINDFYVTDSFIIESLLKKEYFNKRILEPACGTGAISEVLKKHNYFVFSSDKYDHNYGTIYDFFDILYFPGDVVTNPPFTIALEFVLHALEIVQEGSKVAMLLRLQFLEGQKRFEKLFKNNPPYKIYVFVKRQNCYKNGIEEKQSSIITYAWFIWKKGYKGYPFIDWIN